MTPGNRCDRRADETGRGPVRARHRIRRWLWRILTRNRILAKVAALQRESEGDEACPMERQIDREKHADNTEAVDTSEERRVGQEGGRTCRARWWPSH